MKAKVDMTVVGHGEFGTSCAAQPILFTGTNGVHDDLKTELLQYSTTVLKSTMSQKALRLIP